VTDAQTPEDQHLLVERDGPVLIVTMNRPERRNALSPSMMEGMAAAWDEVNANPDIRVAILTGAGGCFCAGADLQAMTETHPGDAFQATSDQQGSDTVSEIAGGVIKPLLKGFLLDKPLIAAVEGPAVAGGTEILQGTDIRVAGESAVFGVTEVQRGLFPMAGSAVRLRRQIGYAVAAEMLLTGEDLTAQRAHELGLVNHVVPDGQALAKAREIADRIARNGPLAVKAILATLRETEAMPEADASVSR
jgi:enoyl-CoA hydratase